MTAGHDAALPTLPPLLQAVATARLWAAGRQPYAAVALFALQPVTGTGPAMVAVDRRWRLFVRPEVADDWSPAQLGTALLHQIAHLCRDHWQRRKACVGALDGVWQLAADAEVNDDLLRDGLLLAPPAVTPRLLGAPDGMLAEDYAERLIDGDVSGAWVRSALGERPGCGTFLAGGSSAERDDLPPGLDPAELQVLAGQVEAAAAGVRGQLPGEVLRPGVNSSDEEVDWRQLLARYLRLTATTASGYADYTYSRPARRAAASRGVVLPALRQPRPVVAVVVDTSGSISPPALRAALTEVHAVVVGLSARLGHLWVLVCDAAVHDVRVVRSPGDLGNLQLVGGGGTDLRIGIAAAAALRPAPEVTVVLTDGRTPWPDGPSRSRLVIGLLGGYANAVDLPPWALVLPIGSGAIGPGGGGRGFQHGGLASDWRKAILTRSQR